MAATTIVAKLGVTKSEIRSTDAPGMTSPSERTLNIRVDAKAAGYAVVVYDRSSERSIEFFWTSKSGWSYGRTPPAEIRAAAAAVGLPSKAL